MGECNNVYEMNRRMTSWEGSNDIRGESYIMTYLRLNGRVIYYDQSVTFEPEGAS